MKPMQKKFAPIEGCDGISCFICQTEATLVWWSIGFVLDISDIEDEVLR